MAYFVYILRTSGNTLYTGQTNNLEKRIQIHQSKSGKSAKYLRPFTTVELVFSEEFPDKSSALKREMEIKSWSKKQKEELILGKRNK